MLAITFLAVLLVEAEQVVIYTMPGCRACEILKEDIADEPSILGDRVVEWRDISDGRHPGVRTVPTIVLARDGREIARLVGYRSRSQLRQWFAEKAARLLPRVARLAESASHRARPEPPRRYEP